MYSDLMVGKMMLRQRNRNREDDSAEAVMFKSRPGWSQDADRLWLLFSRGMAGYEIARSLSRPETEIQRELSELGMERIQDWSVRFAGREHAGMWDDSWQAERYGGSGGHVHFHPSRNRTFKNRAEARASALRKARAWVENGTNESKP